MILNMRVKAEWKDGNDDLEVEITVTEMEENTTGLIHSSLRGGERMNKLQGLADEITSSKDF